MTLERIKVLEVTNTLGLGGTEKTAEFLAKNLCRDFFDVSVCGLKAGGERVDILTDDGCEVFVASSDIAALAKWLKERRFDIIHWHSHGASEPFLLRAIDQAVYKSLIVRTNVFGSKDDSPESRNVGLNIFVSKFCFLRYARRYGSTYSELYKNFKVVYNPVECARLETDLLRPDENRELRIKYGIPLDALLIGRFGRPDDSKFGGIVIEMMPYLVRLQPDVRFVVIGMTSQKMQRIKELGLEKYFIIIPPTADSDELYKLYHLLDVYAHSATWGESFGCGIAEAMACGKPVVTHSTPFWDNAQIELVDHEKTGFVANHPRLYAQAVDKLLRDPKHALLMGGAGLKKARALYDIKSIARQTEKLYLEALQAQNVVLSPALTDYLKTSCSPYLTIQELDGFCQDYKHRLSKSFGRPVLTERLRLLGNNVMDTLRVIKERVWKK